MNTPPSWLTPHAAAAAQHPAAHRQLRQTKPVGGGHMLAYTASRSSGALLHDDPYAAPTAHWVLPRADGVDGDPHFESMYSEAPELPGRADAYQLNDVEARFPVGLDGLAFGAPGLAEAMVHQEASARESAEQMLEEERARCELLQHEIQRLQAQLTGRDVSWKCPICCAVFPRIEKDVHGRRCLTQFVEFVQSGSGVASGR